MNNTESAKLLARIVLRAQEIHEEKWSMQQHRGIYGHAFQHWCAANAAKELGAPELTEPVYLLSVFAWNDIQEWAREQV